MEGLLINLEYTIVFGVPSASKKYKTGAANNCSNLPSNSGIVLGTMAMGDAVVVLSSSILQIMSERWKMQWW